MDKSSYNKTFLIAVAFFFGALTAIGIVYINALLIFGGIIGLGAIAMLAKKPIYGIALIAFFLPFERIGAVERFGITIRMSQILLFITSILWVMTSILRKRFTFRPYPIGIFVGIFLVGSVLSLLNAPNIERSVTVLGFTIFTILLSFLATQLITTREHVHMVLHALLLAAFLVSLFGIFQFIGDVLGLSTDITGLRQHYTKAVLGFPRIQSTASEPLYFANYLLLPIAVVLSLLLARNVRRPTAWVFLLLLLVLNLVLTVSRGGYIAIVPVVLIIAGYYLHNVISLRTIIIALVGAAIIWFGATAFLELGDNNQFNLEVFSEHVTNVFSGASYNERLYTFDEAVKLWKEHPLLGIGPGSFGPAVAIHPYREPSDGWLIVNNETIELVTETGILGTLAIALMLIILFVRTIKAVRVTQDPWLTSLLIALSATLVGYLVQYQTFSTLYIMHIWFTIGLTLAVQTIALNTRHEQ